MFGLHPVLEARVTSLSQPLPPNLLIHHPNKDYERVSLIEYLHEISYNHEERSSLVIIAIGSIS